MALDNNGETHGYLWRDGVVHTTPEVNSPYSAADQRAAVSLFNQATEKPTAPHVTQAAVDKAYADWLKEYAAWKKRMAAWEAKYGNKV